MSEVNTTVEQVEQNEMEEYLSPIDYDFIDHETQFHIQEIYNKLKAEKEELESQAEFFKKECDRFGDEAIDLEIYKEHSVNLEDLTPEERQLELAKVNERDLNDIIQALNDELSEKERQLEDVTVFAKIQCELQHHGSFEDKFEIFMEHKKIAEQLKEKGQESLHRPSLGEYLSDVIRLNFEDVKRTDCCTKTADWILEKIEQWEK